MEVPPRNDDKTSATRPTLDVETRFEPTEDHGAHESSTVLMPGRRAAPESAASSSEVLSGWPLRVGPYRIVELLGEGGMGRVFLAEQTEPLCRPVALKQISASYTSPHLRRRFEAEAGALARMSHPNIAQVFESGLGGDGAPYIAMEYIDGPSIAVYADRHRLTIAQRLSLFASVCDGIQHAHEKAILHRDIKPSNVLVAEVDGVAVPKIIDFGIAKALDRNVGGTVTEHVVGTPGYLSPEAIDGSESGWHVDTRSDIYSLGVLLFELLTGSPPFGKGSSMEVMRRIVEHETPRPSFFYRGATAQKREKTAARRGTDPKALARSLRGELDWIVGQAMAKNRQERYPTAAELAAEVRRFLDHRPVLAGPPSAVYRARKWVRRHVPAVLAATLVLVTLVGGLIARGREAARANREAVRANEQAVAAQQVADFLVGLFREADPGSERPSDATARELLDRGATKIRRDLAEQPVARARLMDTIGEAYVELSLLAEAESLLREALDLRETRLGPTHPETLESLVGLGSVLQRDGRPDEAEPLLKRALGALSPSIIQDEAAAAMPYALLRAQGLMEYAAVRVAQGRVAMAGPLLREALALRRSVLDPDDPSIAATLNNLANLSFDLERWDEAEMLHEEAIAIKEKALGPDHYHLAQSLNNLANVYLETGDLDRATTLHQRALAIKRRALPPEHPELGVSLHNLGDIARQQGHPAEAIVAHREALSIFEAALGSEHPFVGHAAMGLAAAHRDTGDLNAAQTWFRRSLEIRDDLDPSSPLLRESIEDYAVLLREMGREEEARALEARLAPAS